VCIVHTWPCAVCTDGHLQCVHRQPCTVYCIQPAMCSVYRRPCSVYRQPCAVCTDGHVQYTDSRVQCVQTAMFSIQTAVCSVYRWPCSVCAHSHVQYIQTAVYSIQTAMCSVQHTFTVTNGHVQCVCARFWANPTQKFVLAHMKELIHCC